MLAGVRVPEVWDGDFQWFSGCSVVWSHYLAKYFINTEITLVANTGDSEIFTVCIPGTIGDLSDGESLSGHDGDSILGDPTGSVRKGKRPIRKTARARTVLSEKQLNILKTCYSANPRPDALMKVSLANICRLLNNILKNINIWYLIFHHWAGAAGGDDRTECPGHPSLVPEQAV